MTTVVDLVTEHLDRMPDARKALATDRTYQLQFTLLRRLLLIADAAMADEHIPEPIRERIIRTVLNGAAPHEDDALHRVEDLATMIRTVVDSQRTLVIPPELLKPADAA